jgi:hypothetical protein
MIRRIFLITALLYAGAAMAQNRYDGIALGPRGPVAGATIAVCTQPATTTTAPCTPLASLFTDTTLTVAAPNPTHADALGNFHFYIAGGFYTVQIYGAGISPPTVLRDQSVFSGNGTVTNVAVTNNVTSLLTLSVTNPTTTPNLIVGFAVAPANNVFGNCTTSPAPPAYCFITGTMLPFPGASSLGGIQSKTCPTHTFVSLISNLGVVTCTQPSAADISGLSVTQLQGTTTASLCTPPSSNSFDACAFTFTWTTPFADAAYVASCFLTEPGANGGAPATNLTNAAFIASQAAGSMSIVIQNLRGAQNTPSAISCIGVHP